MSGCQHDLSDVEIITRSSKYCEVEVEGPCPKCGENLYGHVVLGP